MKSIAPIDFSNVIGFLLPGFVAFYSLRYISPSAYVVMEGCFSKNPSAAIFLVVVLVSLTAGVAVAAVRSLLLDSLQFKTGVAKPEMDYSKLTDEGKLAAFNTAIANTYRFAQFYGNMFVAILMLLAVKLWFPFDARSHWSLYATLAATVVVLFFAHRQQLGQTHEKLKQILSM